MERLKHYSIKLLTACLACALLLSLTSLIVLNSGLLDRFAKERVLALFNEKFYGRLALQELHLQFPNNITLINPRIYAPGETTAALEAERISLKCNMLSLLQPDIRKLYFRRLTAEKLNARIVEESDGKLNLELIFRSRDPDSTKAPLDHFFCKALQVHNSQLSFATKRGRPGNWPTGAKNIDVELSSCTVKKNFLRGTIEKLRFELPEKRFFVRQVSGNFLFSESRSELLALKIAANNSRAELSATVDHFNIFSRQRGRELARATSFLNVQELALQGDDLKLFYPSLVAPPGIYTLKGDAKGKKDDVTLIGLLLQYHKSKIALKGELLNLLDSNAFAYDLQCDSSKIAGTFADFFLKESPLKEIASKSGDITFFGKAKGSLKAVKGAVTTHSLLGEISVDGEASGADARQVACKGSFVVKGGKPHLFMMTENGQSLLNASGSFEGRGESNEVSHLLLDMKLADSFWQNQPVKEGSLTVRYDDRLLNTSLFLQNNVTSLTLDGEIDWKERVARYRASGKTAAFDLSKVLGSKVVATDLNGVFAVQGAGFDPRMLNLAASIQFSPSAINGFPLKDRSKVAVEIVQSATASRASIKSDFLDLSAEGNYTFEELIALSKLAASAFGREVAAQNIWLSAPPAASVPATGVLKQPFTLTYRIAAKDISPLALFFPLQGISLKGSAEGSAMYRDGQCSLGASINLGKLSVRKDFSADNLALKGDVVCSSSGVPRASVTGRASAMRVAGKEAGETVFSGSYTPSHLEGTVNLAVADPAERLSATFTAIKAEAGYDLLFEHLSMTDSSGLWLAEKNSRLFLGKNAARFNRFTLAKGVQQAVLHGELSDTQAGTFQCTLSNIELNELKRFSLTPSLNKLAGTINGSLTVSGNPDSKSTSLRVSGKNIRFDEIVIGTLQANALQSGSQLRFELHSSPAGPDKGTKNAPPLMNTIDGSGTIPLALGYYPLNFRMVEQERISATFRSDNLSAQFLRYVLPFFESAEGIIPTRLTVEGKMPNPDIYLTTHLQNTSIKIEPTQVSYRLNGNLSVTPTAVELHDITVNDNSNGEGVISGVVRLDRLKPTELDLTGKFNRLLLFNKKDKEDETSFGTITGSTRTIQLHGTLSEPLIEGELRIDAADFSLYRSGANESTKYVGIDRFIEFIPRYPSQSSPETEKRGVAAPPVEFYHSLIDILQIKNLKLSSSEPLKLTVIFDRLRGEQLESTSNNLSLMVNKSNQKYQLFGSVNVIGGKYKFSNSNFDLQDGGKISWNSVDIRSGVMNNLYGSKLISVSSKQNGDRDNVKLLLAITGTLNTPQVAMGYYLNEQAQPFASVNMIGGQSSQIDSNAELNVISLLLYKQWYIRPGSNGTNSALGVSSVGLSAGTGILSSRISRLIQNVGGLESFNLNVGMDKRGALSGLDLYFALNVPGTGGKVRFIGTGTSPGSGEASTANSYYGTAQKIEYRVTPKVYLEASRSYGQSGSAMSSANLQKPADTWGVSISYKERFQTWDKFWKHLFPSSDKTR